MYFFSLYIPFLYLYPVEVEKGKYRDKMFTTCLSLSGLLSQNTTNYVVYKQ